MPVLLVILVLAVFAYAWVARRGSTLTRACRWRLNRAVGQQSYRCAACGAVTESVRAPKQCLRHQDDFSSKNQGGRLPPIPPEDI